MEFNTENFSYLIDHNNGNGLDMKHYWKNITEYIKEKRLFNVASYYRMNIILKKSMKLPLNKFEIDFINIFRAEPYNWIF